MLTIYRASAGTGKTHKLTGEYLRLLFGGTDAHARILSVTFTNKATEEMKSRILNELHRMASDKPSDYLPALMQAYGLTNGQARRQARHILIRLLHDYAAFNVSTIDHFFQQIMRAFIRELGLQGNYRIEMDVDTVLSESVDQLLSGLDQAANKDLLGWLLRFGEDRVERGESWDVRHEVKRLGYELFKEKYKTAGDHIAKDIEDKQALGAYKDALQAILHTTEGQARRLGEQALAVLSRHGLHPSDFKGGSRSPLHFFERLAAGVMGEPSATFRSLADSNEAFYTRTTPPDKQQAIRQACEQGLMACVQQTIRFFDDLAPYYTARQVMRFYYTLGILTDISQRIKAWMSERNRMLISDTTDLLRKIIGGSDVPFIYEKTGTRIEHYMIDEFQDTSRMQWHNFRPLIEESLSYHRDNLIVGDVKQSIYRFRNSDWTLLDEQVAKAFPGNDIAAETLTENWRSRRLIVEFNNAFFTAAPLLLQQQFNTGLEASTLDATQRARFASQIVSAYARSFQRVSAPFRCSEGHVRIDCLPDEDESDWKTEAMTRLPRVIDALQDKGYLLRDIAILVRTKAEGVTVANTLLACRHPHSGGACGYDIISEDALIVGNALSVRFIVSVMQYVNSHTSDAVLCKYACMLHFMLRRKTASASDVASAADALTAGFRKETVTQLKRLSHRSLYETAEGIYRLFDRDMPENEQVFIQSFLDLVAEYTTREPADMTQFLRWWKEAGHQSKIATPDTQNAIRIMTIHKSKGLGFKAVIIPFADWETEPKSGTIFWCSPTRAPFDRFHLVPVSYSKELGKTLFANDYYAEKLYATIDNLNALYVAFTRAKEELIVFTPAAAKRTKQISGLIRDCLTLDIAQTAEGEKLMPLSEGFRETEGVFEWGSSQSTGTDEADAVQAVPMRRIPSVQPDERLHLRLHHRNSFAADNHRRYGLMMHDLLSKIHTAADIPSAIAEKESAGEIDKVDAAKLTARLVQLLEKQAVRQWFDGSMRVMNEAEILYGNGQSRRPDRIMIDAEQLLLVDYKFGEQKDTRHQQQIRKYISLVHQIGYQYVKGYIWYVELDEIEEVCA